MVIANLLIVLIILGCVAYQYLQSTLVKSVVTIIAVISASAAAFGYFEVLAGVFINRDIFVPWARTISFGLLFILTFAVLQTAVTQLMKKPIDLGVNPERIGRVITGIFLGLLISGALLTALAMAPLKNKHPYRRFEAARPDAEKPKKVLFNADGFVTGWFNIISSGSLSGKRSFAALHPAFLNEAFLTRHSEGASVITWANAIRVPAKNAAWPAPQGLKDADGQPLSSRSGYNLTIVRIELTGAALSGNGFTFSQLRVICARNAKNPTSGRAKAVYPIGYLKTVDRLNMVRLNEWMDISRDDLQDGRRPIDFAFYVPDGYVPAIVAFKQNCIAQVPALLPAEKAPEPMPFIPLSAYATTEAQVIPATSAKIHGVKLLAREKATAELRPILRAVKHWRKTSSQNDDESKAEEARNDCFRAMLKIKEPDRKKLKDVEPAVLESLDGYMLFALKCNEPAAGVAIEGHQLPVLVQTSDLVHHAVGIMASGKSEDQIIYEFQYCCLIGEEQTDRLTIAEDGSVAKPFVDAVSITQQAETISQFYVLYLVKSDANVIIRAVKPAEIQEAAGFKKYEGFLTE